jgi:hypothetical protein
MAPGTISVNLDLSKAQALGGDPDALLELMNRAYLRGQMSSAVREVIRPAIVAYPASLAGLRAQTALYLTASSPPFAVQR